METYMKLLRIRKIMEVYHLSQVAMATKIGIDQANLSGILNGKRPCGKGVTDKILLAFPDINDKWLLSGDGEMTRPKPSVTQNNYNGNNNYVVGNGNSVQCSECGAEIQTLEAEEVERAPIIPATLARAPQTDVLEAVQERIGKLELAPVGVIDTPVSLWYRVQDGSLAPRYEIGDLIALWAYPKGEEDPIPGKLYGINTLTNGLIIRKLFPAEDGYIARAVNKEDFPDYKIKAQNVVQIYKIMLMVRF